MNTLTIETMDVSENLIHSREEETKDRSDLVEG